MVWRGWRLKHRRFGLYAALIEARITASPRPEVRGPIGIGRAEGASASCICIAPKNLPAYRTVAPRHFEGAGASSTTQIPEIARLRNPVFPTVFSPVFSRPPTKAHQKGRVQELYAQGVGKAQIARELEIARAQGLRTPFTEYYVIKLCGERPLLKARQRAERKIQS